MGVCIPCGRLRVRGRHSSMGYVLQAGRQTALLLAGRAASCRGEPPAQARHTAQHGSPLGRRRRHDPSRKASPTSDLM